MNKLGLAYRSERIRNLISGNADTFVGLIFKIIKPPKTTPTPRQDLLVQKLFYDYTPGQERFYTEDIANNELPPSAVDVWNMAPDTGSPAQKHNGNTHEFEFEFIPHDQEFGFALFTKEVLEALSTYSEWVVVSGAEIDLGSVMHPAITDEPATYPSLKAEAEISHPGNNLEVLSSTDPGLPEMTMGTPCPPVWDPGEGDGEFAAMSSSSELESSHIIPENGGGHARMLDPGEGDGAWVLRTHNPFMTNSTLAFIEKLIPPILRPLGVRLIEAFTDQEQLARQRKAGLTNAWHTFAINELTELGLYPLPKPDNEKDNDEPGIIK